MKEVEIWKNIKDYEEHYQISNYGRVKSLCRISINIYNEKRPIKGKVLILGSDSHNYLIVKLYKNNNEKNFKVHRLVAQHFISNPKNKLEVNHIDGNKKNNHSNNLEWTTHKENMQHAWKNKLTSNDSSNKKVFVYDNNNILIKEFKSQQDANKWRGVAKSTLSEYFWKRKDSKGYIWKH